MYNKLLLKNQAVQTLPDETSHPAASHLGLTDNIIFSNAQHRLNGVIKGEF